MRIPLCLFTLLLGSVLFTRAQDADFMKYRGSKLESGRDQATENGFYSIEYLSQHASSLLNFNGGTSTGNFQMEAFYWGDLKFRNKVDYATWQP